MYLYYILQLVLMIPLGGSIFFALFFENSIFIIAGLIQFVLGIEQVMGGLIQAFLYKSKLHLKYSIGAILYVLFLGISEAFMDYSYFLGIILIGIIPWIIATWYTYICYKYYKNPTRLKSFKISYEDDELILDDTRNL